MSTDYTKNIKLAKESDDEIIDPFAYNWPLLDKTAGALVVADGAIPTDDHLSDGCILVEQPSGRERIFRKLLTGTYTFEWLHYPWQISAYKYGNAVLHAPQASVEYGFSAVNTADGINSSLSDLNASGFIKAPIKGIYSINAQGRWASSASGVYSMFISINSFDDWPPSNIQQENQGSFVLCNTTLYQKLNAGDTISIKEWQSSGVTKNVDNLCVVTLISPVT